jgi:hypothetical protein
VALSDDEIVRLSDKWLEDEQITLHFSALYDEFASSIPVVAESVEALSRKAYDMPHIFPSISNCKEYERISLETSRALHRGLRNDKRNSSTITHAQIDAVPSYSEGRREFSCTKCRRAHDRASRARDCANQDLGLTPYQCRGACGDTNWSVLTFKPIQGYLLT